MRKLTVCLLCILIALTLCLTACEKQPERPSGDDILCNGPPLYEDDEGNSTLLAAAATAEKLSYEERKSEGFQALLASVNAFSAKLSQSVYNNYTDRNNLAVSPISVYMALAIAAECASGNTREEILSARGVTSELLNENFPLLYRSLNVTYKDDKGEIASMLDLNNSIWIDYAYEVKGPTLQTLAEQYFCNSVSADFVNDNQNANYALRKFIKDKTHNLIDQDFKLSEETVFAIINTLYLKDVWNLLGDDLEFTQDSYSFNDSKVIKLLQGYYNDGQIYEADTYTHFYTETYNNYKLKFILPKDGHTIEEVFTAENIATVNGVKDYGAYDEETDTKYYTRCLFPEFRASYNHDIAPILQKDFAIKDLFDNVCNFGALSDMQACCSAVLHVTELKVDKKGIEGAAVTIMPVDGDAAPPKHKIYSDFVVDKSFGYIITDYYGAILFTGVVENV